MASARNALWNHALTVALLLSIAVVVNIIVTRHLDARADLTEEHANTLSPGTIRTIQSLPDRARVRAFFTKEIPPEAVPRLEPAMDVLAQIERNSNGRVAVDYLDPSKSAVAAEAKKLGISALEAQVRRKDRLEKVSLYFGVEIRCADRPSRVIPFLDILNAEYELARALKAVADEAPVQVAFLSREPAEPPKMPGIEMPPQEGRLFQAFRDELKDRYAVVDLAGTQFGEPIPEGVAVLVVPRPDKLDPREVFEIDQFLMRGGRALFLVDRHVYDGSFAHSGVDPGLDALFKTWGVSIPTDSIVVDQSHQMIPIQKRSPLGGAMTVPVEYFPFLSLTKQTEGFSLKNPMTKNLQRLTLLWASPIEVGADKPASIDVETLLQTSKKAWRTKEVENLIADDGLSRRVTEKFVSQAPQQEKLAVALVGKLPSLYAGKTPPPVTAQSPQSRPAPDDTHREVKALSQETRVVIIGDSDLARNEVVGGRDRAPGMFLGNVIDWLALDQDLISIRSREQARPIRDLDGEALKELGIENTAGAAASIEDLMKQIDQRDQNARQARDLADAKRDRLKWINILGPGSILMIAGLLRFQMRRRARRAAAAAAAMA